MIIVRCRQADRDSLKKVKINPEDLKDNGDDYLDVRILKPWGHEKERYRDEDVSVWWLDIRPDKETSMHCHPNKTTLLHVVSGRGWLLTLHGEFKLSEGEVVVIEKGAFHRTRSDSNGMRLYELETPPNKRDLVRLEDKYGRGQGYEPIGERHEAH